MQQSNKEIYRSQTDDIDLRALFNSLVVRKFLIAGLTGFVTVLAILYALNLTPTYQVSSSFTSPSTASIATINKLDLTEETKESVFSAFLTQLSSKGFQKIAFVEGDYLTQFNADNAPIDDVDVFITGTVKSVKVKGPNLKNNDLTELPYILSMQGNNPEAMSQYLNELVAMANSKIINDLVELIEKKISIRLEEISLERRLLITKAKNKRLNEIGVLTEAAKTARSLGISENNFKRMTGNQFNSNQIAISLGDNTIIPNLYLYGEIALLKKIQILESRSSDKFFIPALIAIDIEKIKLESEVVAMNSVSAMKISQVALIPKNPIKPNKRMIILLAFIVSFIMSILLALIMGAVRPDEKTTA